MSMKCMIFLKILDIKNRIILKIRKEYKACYYSRIALSSGVEKQ
jgi:hypothetical protein